MQTYKYCPRTAVVSARSASLALVIVALTSLGSVAYGQSDQSYGELPNFYKVNEHLYRGGQPREGGIQKLAGLGVKTIINLRTGDEVGSEEKDAAKANIRYFSIPMAGIGRPTDQEMSRVMAIIDAPENWPVFIHCRRGADRTGTVVACYRISHENWDAGKATAEARKFGMSWIEVGMRGYISDYYKSHARVAAVQAAPTQTAAQASNP